MVLKSNRFEICCECNLAIGTQICVVVVLMYLLFLFFFLGNGMTGIANHARSSQYEQFGESVRSVGRSVCSLVEAAAQAAYLVGVAQPGSKAGTAGLVDQSLFCRALNDITAACSVLCDSSVAPGRTEVKFLSTSEVNGTCSVQCQPRENVLSYIDHSVFRLG